MSELHILWAGPLQPATRYRVEIPDFSEPPKPSRWRWITRPAHARGWCFKCQRRRYLKNMVILDQPWYDPELYCVQCPPRKRRKRKARV